MSFDEVITSTLQRAVQTAQYLLSEDVGVIKTHLCCERNYGGMQGLTEEEVKTMRPKIMYIYEGDDYHSLNPPGGESFEEVRERAERFFDFILGNYYGKKVLVVSHFTFLQQFHGLLKGHDWITSLGEGIGNLQCYTFHLQGTSLLRQEIVPLVEKRQCNW
jgi:probable phosphoglycerate mutase